MCRENTAITVRHADTLAVCPCVCLAPLRLLTCLVVPTLLPHPAVTGWLLRDSRDLPSTEGRIALPQLRKRRQLARRSIRTGAPDYLLGQSSSFVSLSLGLGRPMLPSATSTGRSLTVLPGSTRGGRRAVPFRASTFRLRLKARAWGGSAPTTGDRFRQYRRRIGGADTGTEEVG